MSEGNPCVANVQNIKGVWASTGPRTSQRLLHHYWKYWLTYITQFAFVSSQAPIDLAAVALITHHTAISLSHAAIATRTARPVHEFSQMLHWPQSAQWALIKRRPLALKMKQFFSVRREKITKHRWQQVFLVHLSLMFRLFSSGKPKLECFQNRHIHTRETEQKVCARHENSLRCMLTLVSHCPNFDYLTNMYNNNLHLEADMWEFHLWLTKQTPWIMCCCATCEKSGIWGNKKPHCIRRLNTLLITLGVLR